MFKIDTATAAAAEPAIGAAGTPGFFTDGDPASNIPATIVSADWFNQITDELLAIVTAASIAPAKATRNQVLAAINFLINRSFNTAFIAFAGNPNGNVAGVVGVPGTSFPTVVWDTVNKIWWVCTTTGNAAAAVWAEAGESAAWPFWCGTSTGTANAQVLATPAVMLSFGAGTAVAWQVGVGLTNTNATTLQVGTFGTFPLRKDGPTGPIPLSGGELVAAAVGNMVSARFDGTFLHLVATEMGTSALANASSNTGTVAAVQGAGALTIGNLAVFADAQGTVKDGGLPGGAAAPVYINIANNGQTLATGVYLVDTSLGAFSVNLPAAPALGACLEFIDAAGTWSPNNFTVGRNGKTIMGVADNLVCNVGGEDFRIWYDSTNTWRFE